jgi:hypothetical protein
MRMLGWNNDVIKMSKMLNERADLVCRNKVRPVIPGAIFYSPGLLQKDFKKQKGDWT